MDEHFKQYATSKNEDGTINIHDVEIFKLGKHKGGNYDEQWAAKAIGIHEREKEDGYLPAVIIGHNDGKNEKPAKAFFDNLALDNDKKVLKTDIVRVPANVFNELKGYPNRSVEVDPKSGTITALALLGGTRPYHKLPLLEFGENAERVVIDFEEGELAEAIDQEDKMIKLRNIFYKMMDFIDRVMFDKEKSEKDKKKEVKSLLSEGVVLMGKEAKKFEEDDIFLSSPSEGGKEGDGEEGNDGKKPFKEDDKMGTKFTEEDKRAILDEQIKHFQEQYGMTPEEAAKQVQKFREDQEAAQAQARKDAIKQFADKLKDPEQLGIKPAIVDELIVPFMEGLPANGATIKFKDGDADTEKDALEYFTAMLEKVLKLAGEDALRVPFAEVTTGVEFEGVKGDPALTLDRKATQMAEQAVEDGKFKDFGDAYEHFVMKLADKKGQ